MSLGMYFSRRLNERRVKMHEVLFALNCSLGDFRTINRTVFKLLIDFIKVSKLKKSLTLSACESCSITFLQFIGVFDSLKFTLALCLK